MFGLKKTKDPWRKKPLRTVFYSVYAFMGNKRGGPFFELSFWVGWHSSAAYAGGRCPDVAGPGSLQRAGVENNASRSNILALRRQPLVSAWIPFEDVTIQNSATAYVPGSHKAGRLKVVDITHSTDPYEFSGGLPWGRKASMSRWKPDQSYGITD